MSLETRARPDLAQPEVVEMPRAAAGPIAEKNAVQDVPLVNAESPPVSVIDDSLSLDKFFEALARTARKEDGAITRIVHYGDSVVASDFASGTLRRKLQAEFGDAGHGYVLIANPWPGYFHNDVYRRASRGWKVSRVVGPYQKDGLYGLGGVSFIAPPGMRSFVGTNKEGQFGTRMSHFELWYLEQPHGGELRLSVDGEEPTTISTEGPEPRARVYELALPDGEHEIEMVTAGGMTRTFGFVLERDVPGVVLDALGIVGARIRFLDKSDDAHWAEALERRSPNLLVFQFGANESGDGFAYSMEDYHRTMMEVLTQAKRAVPGAGCFIIGAMDRARKENERLVTVPVIPLIVKEQAKVAREANCAFFNTFEAMGGRGSMAKWVRRGYGAGDFTHPTSVGAEVLGNWFYRALMERYRDYAERTAAQRP